MFLLVPSNQSRLILNLSPLAISNSMQLMQSLRLVALNMELRDHSLSHFRHIYSRILEVGYKLVSETLVISADLLHNEPLLPNGDAETIQLFFLQDSCKHKS